MTVLDIPHLDRTVSAQGGEQGTVMIEDHILHEGHGTGPQEHRDELDVGVGGDGEDILVAAKEEMAPFPVAESRRAFQQRLLGLIDLAFLHQFLRKADEGIVALAFFNLP